MKSFLLYKGHPIIKFSLLEDGIFYEGELPGDEYDLAVCPTNERQIVVDIDCKPGKSIGYYNIPDNLYLEMMQSFHYLTKSGGMHVFLNYVGNKLLKNCTTKYSIDCRVGANKKTGNAGGFVRWNSKESPKDIEHLIKSTSSELNKFLEELFS